MSPIVIVAALAVASSVPLMLLLVAGTRPAGLGIDRRAVSRNLASAVAAPTDVRRLILAQPVRERAVQPVFRWLDGRLRRMTPHGVVQALERRLQLAGEPWRIEHVLAAKVVLAGLATGASLVWVLQDPSPAFALLVPVANLVGWLTPDTAVAHRAEARQRRIRDDLPDSLDQLTICVEAGLAFDAGLARVAQTGDGPLAAEIGRVIQDVQLGMPRGDALERLLERTDVPELRQFVHAIHQAEVYGVPVARALRAQAAEQRQRRCSRAEERAQKVPVKLVFPLVLCILPALFVVVLGPAALRATRLFS